MFVHWVAAVSYARMQSDVTYEEWCNLYYDHLDPTPDQIEKACQTAKPILVRNNIITDDVEFKGLTSGLDGAPRRDDPRLRIYS